MGRRPTGRVSKVIRVDPFLKERALKKLETDKSYRQRGAQNFSDLINILLTDYVLYDTDISILQQNISDFEKMVMAYRSLESHKVVLETIEKRLRYLLFKKGNRKWIKELDKNGK